MRHYLLLYRFRYADHAERRVPYRGAHLAHAQAAAERGELLLGGALEDPMDGAVLLFRTEGPEVARAFAEADPYVQAGLVESWEVRGWTTVVGEGAAHRIFSK